MKMLGSGGLVENEDPVTFYFTSEGVVDFPGSVTDLELWRPVGILDSFFDSLYPSLIIR